MLKESQFESFLSKENFILAFQRLQTAPRNVYKDLYYEDLKIFGLFLEENIKSLLDEIKHCIFSPTSSYKIFIPKKNNLVRPLSLLKFRDLLIYQAIINVIADVVYNDISPYYNNTIFGNVYNTSTENKINKIFFFKPWKEQWNKFEQRTRKHYEEGYIFLAEFDIASFFDTIDHYTLQQILEKNYIDNRLSSLLLKLLEAFTSDFSHKTFKSKHGIPQGPIGSPFLADLYLFHLDLEIKSSKLNIKYIRYVDDIRIFSKDKITAQRAIAYLDLVARDLGLIPQASKILVSKIDDIDKTLKHQRNKFSAITKEYKKKGSLKAKTHKKLKERFLNCFNQDNIEGYLDKTIISFSLYKLNKDEDVKSILLKNLENLYIHFEAVLFYLKNHFSDDNEVKDWLINILRDEKILFHYLIALVFKFFPTLEFMEDIYRKYMRDEDRHWIVKYFMFEWLYKNNKIELINSFHSDNYFLNREVVNFKFKIIQDPIYLDDFIKSRLKSKDCLISLHALYLSLLLPAPSDLDFSEYNEYIQNLISGNKIDYIIHTLKNEFSISKPELFFNETVWHDKSLYKELSISFRLFFEHRVTDPSKSLLNLNSFNNLVYDQICKFMNIQQANKEYGVNLNSGCIKDYFPIANRCFLRINESRNQKTEAHPYDKYGNLRIRIDASELSKLIENQKKALDELCDFDFLAQYK
ncbi:RNA-directed DNA polymerase [Candidatus Synechococcus calcipolaris G9]|uniref:RNA-directed DNA polymerase n=1 Tax=Candidatus Synechococcus calcipolaris G9 TaxID=1497997 RepID=A0ABT6EVQ5_9SYNE|nr:RNA-directed DNA polymerase [Candidatus Synechococcus calcipolaris]MDG2989874.1 RNA-directed DNA polymerase [Candidatus Synechococcus calcipolaris G9]